MCSFKGTVSWPTRQLPLLQAFESNYRFKAHENCLNSGQTFCKTLNNYVARNDKLVHFHYSVNVLRLDNKPVTDYTGTTLGCSPDDSLHRGECVSWGMSAAFLFLCLRAAEWSQASSWSETISRPHPSQPSPPATLPSPLSRLWVTRPLWAAESKWSHQAAANTAERRGECAKRFENVQLSSETKWELIGQQDLDPSGRSSSLQSPHPKAFPWWQQHLASTSCFLVLLLGPWC